MLVGVWVWDKRTGAQVFIRELHIYIHLDQTSLEFLSCIKKKKEKKEKAKKNNEDKLIVPHGK